MVFFTAKLSYPPKQTSCIQTAIGNDPWLTLCLIGS